MCLHTGTSYSHKQRHTSGRCNTDEAQMQYTPGETPGISRLQTEHPVRFHWSNKITGTENIRDCQGPGWASAESWGKGAVLYHPHGNNTTTGAGQNSQSSGKVQSFGRTVFWYFPCLSKNSSKQIYGSSRTPGKINTKTEQNQTPK